jgi:hypothetical protein
MQPNINTDAQQQQTTDSFGYARGENSPAAQQTKRVNQYEENFSAW